MSKAGPDVTLYALPIILAAFVQNDLNKLMVCFVQPFPRLWTTDYIKQPYIIWGMITAW